MTIRVKSAFFMLLVHLNRLAAAFQVNKIISRNHPYVTKTACSMLEVEQKFVLSDVESTTSIESKLVDLGMAKNGETYMVDWYFDLDVPTLTPLDKWLRYRDVLGKGGVWQLKKGQRHEGGVTVYEEVEGDEAVQQALDIINWQTEMPPTTPITEYEGYQIPDLPDPTCGLVPFCRLETKRTCWRYPHGDSSSLAVDLDVTNYGYMVGEVEIVVETKDEVQEAQHRIEEFARFLLPSLDSEAEPAVGKLEHYLMAHRPEFYRACVERGNIPAKS
jgi:thiamine-triphosphatase